MAYRLSFWRMNRNCQRVCAVLALLLMASLAYAGAPCASASGGTQATGLLPAAQHGCLTAGSSFDACIVTAQRTAIPMAAPSSSEPMPAVSGMDPAAGIFRAVSEPQPPIGLSPAPSSPVYILLRRYLS